MCQYIYECKSESGIYLCNHWQRFTRYLSFLVIFSSHFDSQDLMYLLSQILTSKICVQSENYLDKQ